MSPLPSTGNYLKPSLLDRLTIPKANDYQTGARQPVVEGAGVGIREREYCDTVLRDIEWLFNALAPISLADEQKRRRFPYASASILGYGLRGVLGRLVQDPAEIERAVEESFARFEPRLIVESMELSISPEGHLIEIQVKGVLATEQARREIWIRTDLDTLDSRLRTSANG